MFNSKLGGYFDCWWVWRTIATDRWGVFFTQLFLTNFFLFGKLFYLFFTNIFLRFWPSKQTFDEVCKEHCKDLFWHFFRLIGRTFFTNFFEQLFWEKFVRNFLGNIFGYGFTNFYILHHSIYLKRGLNALASKWAELTPDASKIAVPFGFHAEFPEKELYRDMVLTMNDKLGCVELVYVDNLLVNPYYWGILFVYELSANPRSCYSMVGVSPGATGGLGNIMSLGIRWQILYVIFDHLNRTENWSWRNKKNNKENTRKCHKKINQGKIFNLINWKIWKKYWKKKKI